MLLSIIVPSFNQDRFIARTLDSILAQDWRPLELIVVDGGSRDDTVQILREYGSRHPELRWISEPDRGPADAVNKGLAMARGEVAAIQSSDDLYVPGAFRAVMEAFARHPDHGFLIGHYEGIDADGKVHFTCELPEFSWEAYFGLALCIPQSSIFFRMSVAREAGGWNGAYFGCDLDYWLRLLLRTPALRLDRVLSRWRLHAGGRTHSGRQAEIWDGYQRMIADNQELKSAPWRIRRLAAASRHIFALRFHPTGARRALQWHLLRAFLLHPTFWRWQDRQQILRLLPGRGPLRAARERWRRAGWRTREILARLRQRAGALRGRGARWLERRQQRRAIAQLPGTRLLRALAHTRPEALFVQIGANDGVNLDPLRQTVLATRWRGVLVEPVPYVFERLRRNAAPLGPRVALENVAIADRDGQRPFYHLARSENPAADGLPFWYDELGSFRKEVVLSHRRDIPDVERRLVEIEVPCMRFDTLCRKHGIEHIDVLQMDTEGYDYELLRHIELDRYRPHIVIYEHFHLGAGDRAACRAHVEGLGYETLESGMDTWCLRTRGPDPADARLLALWCRLRPAARAA